MTYEDARLRDVKFQEAAATGDLETLLHEDYKDILLSNYDQAPKNLVNLCYRADSNNDKETWRGLKDLGPTTQKVPELGEFPERMLDDKSTKTITNYKYGDIVSLSREMILYNKLSEFRNLVAFQGEALAQGLEENLADTIETSGNYTAYGSTITLSASNLELAVIKFNTQTTTDAEGRTVRLNLRPNTLLVPPDLEMNARRLLQSQLIPGSANNDINVLQNSLNIVVSHCLASTSVWYLMKANSPIGLILQSVIGPPPETFVQDVQKSQMADSSFRYDKVSYRADMIVGMGVIDSKLILRSTS